MDVSLWLVDWGSLCPPCLICCCAGADRLCRSWFFCLSKVLMLLSHYCSVVFFWVISPPFNCNSRLVLGGGYCGFHSLLCHLPLLSVGVSFVGCFSLLAGILLFRAPTYSFMWSIGVGRQNGIRHFEWECILWDLKYQTIEKRQEILWISVVLTVIFHPVSHFL